MQSHCLLKALLALAVMSEQKQLAKQEAKLEVKQAAMPEASLEVARTHAR